MLHEEQDPSRCRELRRIDDQIKLRIAETVTKENAERRKIAQLESERTPLQSRLLNLRRTQAITNTVSFIPDNIGTSNYPSKPPKFRVPNVIGVGGSLIDLVSAAQITDLEEQIRTINNKIENSRETIRKHQTDYDLLISNERTNAQELSALNCVSP